MTESGLVLAADSTCIPPSKFRQVIVQIEENRRAGAICGIDSAPKRFHVWRARGKQSSFRLGLDLLVRLAHNLLGRRDRPPQRRSRPPLNRRTCCHSDAIRFGEGGRHGAGNGTSLGVRPGRILALRAPGSRGFRIQRDFLLMANSAAVLSIVIFIPCLLYTSPSPRD